MGTEVKKLHEQLQSMAFHTPFLFPITSHLRPDRLWTGSPVTDTHDIFVAKGRVNTRVVGVEELLDVERVGVQNKTYRPRSSLPHRVRNHSSYDSYEPQCSVPVPKF